MLVQPARVRLLFWMSERDRKRLPRRMRCLHAWHVPELPISERPLDLGWMRHVRKRVSPMHRLQLRRSARSLRAVRMQVCLLLLQLLFAPGYCRGTCATA